MRRATEAKDSDFGSAFVLSSTGNVISRGRGIVADIALIILLLGVLLVWLVYNPLTAGQKIASALVAIALMAAPTLGISLIERFFAPVAPRKSPEKWLLHLQIAIVSYISSSVAVSLSTGLLSKLSTWLGRDIGFLDLRISHGHGLLAMIASVFVIFFFSDFFFYWSHRFYHKNNFLWQNHKMHHMDQHFDAMTGPRQNWIDSFLEMFLMTIPISLLFKFDQLSPSELGLVNGTVIGVVQGFFFLNHSNLNFQLGKASALILSSQTHRIHHSCLPHHFDKNFAAWFPVWDIIFGTYYAPKPNEFPPTGVAGEKEIQTFAESLIFTQREWLRMFRAWRQRRSTTFAR